MDGNSTGVRTIKASEFKAKCLKLMDEVAETGQEIVITKNGKPVSRLAPYQREAEVAALRSRGLRHILLGSRYAHLQLDLAAGRIRDSSGATSSLRCPPSGSTIRTDT